MGDKGRKWRSFARPYAAELPAMACVRRRATRVTGAGLLLLSGLAADATAGIVASLVRPPSAEAVPAGTTLFAEDFRGAQVSAQTQNLLTTLGTFALCLTASSNISERPIPGRTNAANSTGQPRGCSGTLPDAPGCGALRLASNSNDSNGFILYNYRIPSSAGLNVRYDSYEYDGGAADMTSFLLRNGADQLSQIGPLGGAGGYDWASVWPSNDCPQATRPSARAVNAMASQTVCWRSGSTRSVTGHAGSRSRIAVRAWNRRRRRRDRGF